ncbi:cytochrome b-c1 complex subunit 1, mitochondrial-like [Plodia interpunctella]|uniref:cytochrome b-c1 complex subunit 1, mitochondrial-like n=1 Tax=Plodia interpunctella TaxID=58824 RepID=UPI002368C53D|nr:cytochrome b-c1 complex subunit 1, mitochondrial-like [Plodia interpunctella]
MLKSSQLLKRVWKPQKISVRNYPYPVQFSYFLRNQPQVQATTMPNGLRVVSQERETYNCCVGLYFDAGSRYESLFENGIAHFFEHIAFKSTRSRSKTILEDLMSCTGAHFRSFTTREVVGYYAECLTQDVPCIVDILSDCIFNNCLCGNEIENQKKIVYAEMLDHDNDTNALLDDYLHATAFQGTPLGRSVMGFSNNLYNFSPTTIHNYLTKYFDPTKTVFAVVGGVKHEQVVSLANGYLCKFEPCKFEDLGGYRYTGSEVRFRDDSVPVSTVALAVEGPCYCDVHDCLVLDVAAHMIGGWDRSQYGGLDHAVNVAKKASYSDVCDSYNTFSLKYRDGGLWGVKFMAPSLKLEDMLYFIQNEFMYLCTMAPVGEVERARRQLKTKILSQLESNRGMCHDLGRSFLYRDVYLTLDELIDKIDRIMDSDVREVCYQYLYDKCPVVAAVGPSEGLPEYNRIRSGMYWLRL